MKLHHAVLTAEKMLERQDLSSEERIALVVVTRFSKRVLAAKRAIRSLEKAVSGEDLNQDELPAG